MLISVSIVQVLQHKRNIASKQQTMNSSPVVYKWAFSGKRQTTDEKASVGLITASFAELVAIQLLCSTIIVVPIFIAGALHGSV